MKYDENKFTYEIVKIEVEDESFIEQLALSIAQMILHHHEEKSKQADESRTQAPFFFAARALK